MENDDIKCPFCNGNMTFKEKNNTYIWVCDDCPNIMFEFYDFDDLVNLNDYLMR